MKAWRREQNLLQVNDEIQQQKNLILRNRSNAKFNIAKSINDITLLKTKLIDINRTQEPISQKATDASIDAETGLIVSDQERVKEWINQQAAKAPIVPVPSVPNTDQSKLTEQVAELVKLMTDILSKKTEPTMQPVPIAVEPPKSIAVDAEPEEKTPAQITDGGEDADKAQPKEGDEYDADELQSPENPFMHVHIDSLNNDYIYNSLKSLQIKHSDDKPAIVPNLVFPKLIIGGYQKPFGDKWVTMAPVSANGYKNRYLFRDYLEAHSKLEFKEGDDNIIVMNNNDMINGIKSLLEYNASVGSDATTADRKNSESRQDAMLKSASVINPARNGTISGTRTRRQVSFLGKSLKDIVPLSPEDLPKATRPTGSKKDITATTE